MESDTLLHVAQFVILCVCIFYFYRHCKTVPCRLSTRGQELSLARQGLHSAPHSIEHIASVKQMCVECMNDGRMNAWDFLGLQGLLSNHWEHPMTFVWFTST